MSARDHPLRLLLRRQSGELGPCCFASQPVAWHRMPLALRLKPGLSDGPDLPRIIVIAPGTRHLLGRGTDVQHSSTGTIIKPNESTLQRLTPPPGAAPYACTMPRHATNTMPRHGLRAYAHTGTQACMCMHASARLSTCPPALTHAHTVRTHARTHCHARRCAPTHARTHVLHDAHWYALACTHARAGAHICTQGIPRTGTH